MPSNNRVVNIAVQADTTRALRDIDALFKSLESRAISYNKTISELTKSFSELSGNIRNTVQANQPEILTISKDIGKAIQESIQSALKGTSADLLQGSKKPIVTEVGKDGGVGKKTLDMINAINLLIDEMLVQIQGTEISQDIAGRIENIVGVFDETLISLEKNLKGTTRTELQKKGKGVILQPINTLQVLLEELSLELENIKIKEPIKKVIDTMIVELDTSIQLLASELTKISKTQIGVGKQKKPSIWEDIEKFIEEIEVQYSGAMGRMRGGRMVMGTSTGLLEPYLLRLQQNIASLTEPRGILGTDKSILRTPTISRRGGFGSYAMPEMDNLRDIMSQMEMLAKLSGHNYDKISKVVTGLTKYNLTLSESLELVKIQNRETGSLTGNITEMARALKHISDITGESTIELAQNSQGLKYMGIEAKNITDAYGAFGYIINRTGISIGEFMRILSEIGDDLSKFGYDIGDVAVLLNILSKGGADTAGALRIIKETIENTGGSASEFNTQLGNIYETIRSVRGELQGYGDNLKNTNTNVGGLVGVLNELNKQLENFMVRNKVFIDALTTGTLLIANAGLAVITLKNAFSFLSTRILLGQKTISGLLVLIGKLTTAFTGLALGAKILVGGAITGIIVGIGYLIKKLIDTRKQVKETSDTMKESFSEANIEIANTNLKLAQARQELSELQKSYARQAIVDIDKIYKLLYQAIKKEIEIKRDMELNSIEDIKKALKEAHDKRMNDIEEEKKKLREKYTEEDEMERINRLKIAIRYETDIRRRAAYEKELAELEKQRGRRLAEEELDKKAESARKEYEAKMKELEAREVTVRGKYEIQLSDKSLTEATEKLMNNYQKNMKIILEKIKTYLGGDWEALGISYGQRLAEGLKDINKYLNELVTTVGNSIQTALSGAWKGMDNSFNELSKKIKEKLDEIKNLEKELKKLVDDTKWKAMEDYYKKLDEAMKKQKEGDKAPLPNYAIQAQYGGFDRKVISQIDEKLKRGIMLTAEEMRIHIARTLFAQSGGKTSPLTNEQIIALSNIILNQNKTSANEIARIMSQYIADVKKTNEVLAQQSKPVTLNLSGPILKVDNMYTGDVDPKRLSKQIWDAIVPYLKNLGILR